MNVLQNQAILHQVGHCLRLDQHARSAKHKICKGKQVYEYKNIKIKLYKNTTAV